MSRTKQRTPQPKGWNTCSMFRRSRLWIAAQRPALMREYSQFSLDLMVVYVPTATEGHEAEEHETEGCETRGRWIAEYTVAILAMSTCVKGSVLSKLNFSVTYCSHIHQMELLTHENNPLKEECKIYNIQKSILYLTVKTPLFQYGDHYCNSI